MKILFIGDVVGKSGRRLLVSSLPKLRTDLDLDLVVANVENVSGGLGVTPKNALEVHRSGVDVLTTGNHIWKHRAVYPFLDDHPWLLRPANFPAASPGQGSGIFVARNGLPVAVLNLQGRTFMQPIDCPFVKVDELLSGLGTGVKIVLVDFHAEATSEKKAMLFWLAGRVSALLGTHTHIQTNDAQVYKGTAYITDAGMSGPLHSVLGMEPEVVVRRFVSQLPQRFVLARGQSALQGVLMEMDAESGQAREIVPWQFVGAVHQDNEKLL